MANETRVARAGTGAGGLSRLVCLSGELIQTLDYPGAAAVTRAVAGLASTRVSAPDDVRGGGGTRVGAGMSLARAKFTNLPRLDDALEWIAASAAERDRAPLPPFPEEATFRLEQAATLARTAQPTVRRPPAADELGLVRAVARADGSVGRIFDGHLNAVERLAVQAPPRLSKTRLLRRDCGMFASRSFTPRT